MNTPLVKYIRNEINQAMSMTYFHATSRVPFMCRVLLRTISEDVCVYIALASVQIKMSI